MLRRVVSLCVLVISLGLGAPVLAQSTNATPILVDTGKPLDPATVPVTSDTDKKYVTDYLAAAKAGGGNSVMTVGANMAGVNYYFSSASNPSNIADTARVSLELCEWNNKAPCFIVSINGDDARADGAWPPQPEMLVKTPGSKLDPWTIPFNSQYNRAIGGWLTSAANPTAVVISTAAGWSSGTGKSALEAIDNAFAACAKTYPNNPCILYAMNGIVVMAQ